MKKRYLIMAPSYSDKSGGAMVLHKLCDILNQIGEEAFVTPVRNSYEINFLNARNVLASLWKDWKRMRRKRYATNDSFNTPVITSIAKIDLGEYIVVYPEVIVGNPLGAPNVVRWFLHKPGFHNGKIYFGKNELHFDYNNFARNFQFPGSTMSKIRLYITHTMTEIYNQDGALPESERVGTAYCLKKGKGKRLIHDIENSVLIDGMTHEEISSLFKRVKTFISYDSYTSYSVYAALSGADSVVVPDDGVSEEQWHPDQGDRLGLAYGFSNIPHAQKTRAKLLEYLLEKESKQISIVKQFAQETQAFFEGVC